MTLPVTYLLQGTVPIAFWSLNPGNQYDSHDKQKIYERIIALRLVLNDWTALRQENLPTEGKNLPVRYNLSAWEGKH